MNELIAIFFVSLSAIFVVVDPVGIVPIFVSLTRNRAAHEIRGMAFRACIISFFILAFFTLFGSFIFKLLHLELNSFRVAGGLLLLLTALDMLRGKVAESKLTPEEGQDCNIRDNLAIVPLSMPLLAGPGSMTTVVVLMSQGKTTLTAVPVLVALLITFVLTFFIFKSAARIQYVLGTSGMLILERVMGLILAAIAVQFIADGGRGLLAS